MPVPDYGAAPLSKFFLLCRALSLIAMIPIIGITSNFVSNIITTNIDPPREVVATLTITCLAAFYTLISIPFFYARAHLGLLIMSALDAGLLLAFIVVAAVLGRPVSFLRCAVVASADAAADARSASIFAQSLAASPDHATGMLGLSQWARSSKANCYETKATWGLCIALCILYACSTLVLPALFFKARKYGGGAKSVV